MIYAISPIDGRYYNTTKSLQTYFSEYALIKYRVYVEIEYLKKLAKLSLPSLTLSEDEILLLDQISHVTENDVFEIKEIEKTTNHDVKAVEYFIKNKLHAASLSRIEEFVHFGLTSQDINNTAVPLSLKNAIQTEIIPKLKEVTAQFRTMMETYHGVPMLARTHGQPASPTTLGKEIGVFHERLVEQLKILENIQIKCKFGGATGNFNAHKVAYPHVNWPEFGDHFCAHLGLVRSQKTTQIAHYDDIAEICHVMIRINTILIDACRDFWQYISMEYFTQRVNQNEVGSSAMPHKVNPIDFENAEGNLGIANAIFDHLALKLPISRLQRDLTDSTVLRNIGVPFAHSVISYTSLLKGLLKIHVNRAALERDLDLNWAVVAEAIQTVLRREGYPKPYEALKSLTRGHNHLNKEAIHNFIGTLDINDAVKDELLQITPHNYLGYY